MPDKEIKISIITPSFNQGKYIIDNIESILSQNYDNFEHIVIDGGSTDDTLSILKKYSHIKWLSEKDEGPVDAIIKGINLSKGKIITWVNSDDYLFPNVLSTIDKAFSDKDIQVVVGNMTCVTPDKKFMYSTDYREKYYYDYLVRVNSDIITQPSTFFLKDLFNKTCGFNKNLKFVWDYDLFLKMFKLSPPVFIDKSIAYQRIYDETISRNNAREQAKEMFKVARENGAKITDPIMKLILKRYIFPSSVKVNPGKFIKAYRRIKKILFLNF